MPCLNEENNLAVSIQKAHKFLDENHINGEILIVDNGSIDNSKKIALKNGARVIKENKKGYGYALQKGIKEAKGKYIIMGDSDGSYNFSDAGKFYDKLKEGYDLVVGNRFIVKMESGAMPYLNRYIGNPFLSWLGRKLFPCEIHDFHCGLRGFNKEKIIDLKLTSKGMEFASEMIVKSVKMNYQMTEIPTQLLKSPYPRKNHLHPFRDGIRHIFLMFNEKINYFK